MAQWRSNDDLRDKFAAHRWDVGVQTVEEHAASAVPTIAAGQRCTLTDPTWGVPRVGYYDAAGGLLVALTASERYVVTPFAPDDGEAYVAMLPDSSDRLLPPEED